MIFTFPKQKKTIFSIALIIAVFIQPFSTAAQSLADTIRLLDKILLENVSPTGPGGVLLVSEGDRIIYHQPFGNSQLENRTTNDTKTIFEAGSVSKQFTATAVLMLIEKGKVNFEDDVRKFIPELPDYGHVIKVKNLLNHTSGLKDWGSVASTSGWPRGMKVYTNDLALDIIVHQKSLNHIPGAEYIYSNSNYTLLTVIAERVSGMSLPLFTQEYIFNKLGMTDTRWRSDFQETVNGRATAYSKKGDVFQLQMPFENTYGHAALLTTAADLDKWNKSWKNSPLGSSQLLQMREKQGVLNNGQIITYASGVNVKSHNGTKEISHSGSTGGYRAWLAYYPTKNLSIVYLSNAGNINPTNLGTKVADVFLGKNIENTDYPPMSAPAEKSFKSTQKELLAFEGIYQSNEVEGFLDIKAENDGLTIKNAAGIIRKFRQIDEASFKSASDMGLVFKKSPRGIITQLLVSVDRARNISFQKVQAK